MTRTDSPRPEDAQLPVHLYTHQSNFCLDDQIPFDLSDSPDCAYGHDDYYETIDQGQNVLIEDFDPYYPQDSESNQFPLDPMFHHSVTSEDERCDDFDSNWQQHYRDPSVNLSTPDLNTFYNDFESCDDHAERQSSPDIYYYEDQSYEEYYDDGEERAAAETYYDEDILENEFKRLDLEPNSQDLEDYPNYGHGVVYPPDHNHSANKPTFFHGDSNQEYHHDCHICADYMEEFYERGYHDGTDSYSDNE